MTLAVAKVDFNTSTSATTAADATAAASSHVWLSLVDLTHPAFTTVAQLEDPSVQDATSPGDYYIARVGWWEDGAVMAQVLLRYYCLQKNVYFCHNLFTWGMLFADYSWLAESLCTIIFV